MELILYLSKKQRPNSWLYNWTWYISKKGSKRVILKPHRVYSSNGAINEHLRELVKLGIIPEQLYLNKVINKNPRHYIPFSKDMKCPFCEKPNYYNRETLINKKFKPKFVSAPDPHYEWVEHHQCPHCHSIYRLKNST